MSLKRVSLCLISALVVGTNSLAVGETIETEWISPEAGFSVKGLQVESVSEAAGAIKVEVSLPKNQEGSIEEVVVVGEAVKGGQSSKPRLKARVEIVNDLEKDRSGIVIYLGKRQQFQLRINYYEPQNP